MYKRAARSRTSKNDIPGKSSATYHLYCTRQLPCFSRTSRLRSKKMMDRGKKEQTRRQGAEQSGTRERDVPGGVKVELAMFPDARWNPSSLIKVKLSHVRSPSRSPSFPHFQHPPSPLPPPLRPPQSPAPLPYVAKCLVSL